MLSLPSPAFAVANPDSIQILEYAVFGDVLEDGDQLFYIRYTVGYTTEPDEHANSTFLMSIYDTDGTTFTGYSRTLKYYGENIRSIYLDADQALTWGVGYYIKLMGNPAIFDPLIEGTNMVTVQLDAGNWYDGIYMGDFLLDEAQYLEDDWGVDLLTDSGKLNSTGSTYFIDAIPGLYDMAPEIFYSTTYYPSVNTSIPWTDNESFWDSKGEKLNGTISNLSGLFGMSYNWTALGITGMFCLVMGSVAFASTKSPGWALVGGGIISLPLMVVMGFFQVGWWMLIFALVGIMFAILFIQGKFS